MGSVVRQAIKTRGNATCLLLGDSLLLRLFPLLLALLIGDVEVSDARQLLVRNGARQVKVGGTEDGGPARTLRGRVHPKTGEPLQIEHLTCPPGTVIVMWSHAAHAVQPKPKDAEPRRTFITGWRQPRCREVSKWMTPSWYRQPTPGLPPNAKSFAILDEHGNPLPSDPTRGEFRP